VNIFTVDAVNSKFLIKISDAAVLS